MTASLEITGVQSLINKLASLQSNIGNDLEHAATKGAMVIEGAAKQNVSDQPGGLHVRTGALRSHIGTKVVTNEPNAAEVEVGVHGIPYARIHEFGGVINASAYHGGYLTFKTPDGTWHRVSRVVIPARPYMRPAIDANKDKIRNVIAADLNAAIKRYAK